MALLEAKAIQTLQDAQRTKQIVYGVIRGMTTLKMPVDEQGKPNKDNKEFDVFTVVLPGNVTGYCHVNNLRYVPLQPRDYGLHVGRREPFIITDIHPANGVAIISCVEALRKMADELWADFATKTDEEILSGEYEVDIIHYNIEKRLIYAFLHGSICYMFPRDWNWSERGALDVQNGEKVKVKITRIDREQRFIRLSRKDTLPDPFNFLASLNINDTIAGKISAIVEGVGTFVRIDNEAEVLAIVPRNIEPPSVGDVVSGLIKKIDLERRQGRVLITGYPNGKKRVRDLGAFLYDE